MPEHDPLDIIFSPAQVARTGTAYIEQRVENKNDGVPFGVPSVDADLLPMLPGELLVLVARPSHGKTMHLMRWARHRANWLQTNQKFDRVVIYLTLEQSIEELHTFHVAAECGIPIDMMARGNLTPEQIEMVRDYGVRRVGSPLWFMGHSIEKRKRRPHVDLSNVEKALARIENWEGLGKRELKIDMVFIDYLQLLPLEGSPESRVVGIDNNLNRLKDLAKEFACPIAVGVQSRREVDDYQLQIPGMRDGAWCSGIEQVPDRVLACVRPIRYKKLGEYFGKTLIENENQMLLVLWKQRLGDAPKFWWMMFDPRYNRLDEAEERDVNFTPKGWDV